MAGTAADLALKQTMPDKRKPQPKTKPKIPRGKPGVVTKRGSTRQPSTETFAAEGMGVAAKE